MENVECRKKRIPKKKKRPYFTEWRNILAGLSWDQNICNVKVIQEF